jgi:hypothetical protein
VCSKDELKYTSAKATCKMLLKLTQGAKKYHLRKKLEKEVTVLKVINEFMPLGPNTPNYVKGY